ncbi:hypothetical protein [Bradyrhizobium elkanii]
MTFASGEPARVVQGRTCGKCSLCCKVVRVDEIAKPAGMWCKDCAPGKGGCKIYDQRPSPCVHFLCQWLITKELGDEWFPAKAKLAVSLEGEGNRIAVHVDPAFPERWREEPYYSMILNWARFGADNDAQVIVNVGKRAIAVFPNKSVDLGDVESEDHIMVGELNLPPGVPRDWDAWIRKAADIPEDERDKWVIKGPH